MSRAIWLMSSGFLVLQQPSSEVQVTVEINLEEPKGREREEERGKDPLFI